ncbi:MAG TPA: lysine 5,6-aminomutase subunit alpha, partial [Candidatus Acidoferrum sp.]|nr:lysine 5,6-aminomutase subunit alpha [Candidatus Acidoferrum sp.]
MNLRIDTAVIDRCRELAATIASPVSDFIAANSTVAVERSVLRLLGVDGVGADEIPIPNMIVDTLAHDARARGVALAFGKALAETGLAPHALGDEIAAGRLTLAQFASAPDAAARGALRPFVDAGLARVRANRAERDTRLAELPQQPPPLLYVIVASGNIYEDRTAAVAAAEAGAQIVAVIRSTGQSLLDFVPYGPTTEGFGG